MKEITINKKYYPLRTSDSRYYIVTGGRGSGKSFAITLNLLLLTYEKGHTILFTRYTMTSAEISIIPEFLKKIELMGKQDDFDITARSITNKVTGSVILFRGIKAGSGMQTANLKSIEGVTTWVLDEAEELHDEDIFDDIDESIRTLDNVNRVMLIMNPRTKAHFIYRKFFIDNGVNGGWCGTKGDVTYIHTTYLDNIENVADSWIKKANKLKERRPLEYQNRFLGGWLDKAKGAVFTNWSLGEFKKLDAHGFGQDYGFSKDASTLIEASIDFDNQIIYVKQAFYKHGLKTHDIHQLNEVYAGDNIIIADRAESRLIEELSELGNNIENCEKPPGSVAYGIKLLQGFDLVIDPESKELIEELQNYQWLAKKDGVPMDKWNHCIDALRYIVYYLNNDRDSGEYYFE
jgi:phage terminase large subunit